MRCSSGNIHKNPKRATKGICLFWFLRIDSISKTRKSNEATKSIFHAHFHTFAPILDQWEVVDVKGNEKPERASTGNEKQ